ncbi:membrane progestin receptor gamma-B-like isoform X3 [Erpetoichthys calabaricus]|uniref:membrane progestin receptor gamma-B-like isoform X3 n=1 Tax=Erpetoichthys calabaricus TaxID=27687 RepID=UPI00109F0CC5|nr:membrane progestin receptor gamma-B-like isoform X3 [Erpetoichthys calabaricus]XP_051776329.1 membrane progestin receptor gamma-B-like isoform X3 [Erpetoichthys calabaricus]
MRPSTSGRTSYQLGTSCGSSLPLSTYWMCSPSPTSGHLSSTFSLAASTPSHPAVHTPSAACLLEPGTYASSSTTVLSVSTALVLPLPTPPTVCQTSWLGLPFLQYNPEINKRIPEIEHPRFSKVLRVLAFAFPYLFDNIPIFYRIFLCSGEGCTDNETNALHYRHIMLAFLTAFLFVMHLPERLAPGCFDYVGHSHQLFHMCAVIGTHFQMEAVIMDMNLRHTWLMSNAPPVTFAWTIGAALVCITLSLLLILIFSLPHFWSPFSSTNDKTT